MPTRNVVLTERHEKLIEALVESGRYQNASEVLRDGLRLVEQREAEDAAKLDVLREAAHVGVAALDRGKFKSLGWLTPRCEHVIDAEPNRVVSDFCDVVPLCVCKARIDVVAPHFVELQVQIFNLGGPTGGEPPFNASSRRPASGKT